MGPNSSGVRHWEPSSAAAPVGASRSFSRWGSFVQAHAFAVIVAWLGAALVLHAISPSWDQCSQDDDIRFLPARCLSVHGYEVLGRAFPKEVFGSKLILAAERKPKLLDADLARLDAAVATIESIRLTQPELGIRSVTSFRDPIMGVKLRSTDGQCCLATVALNTPFMAARTIQAVDTLHAQVAAHFHDTDDEFTWALTGPAGVGRDLTQAAYHSLDATTVATTILVVGILLWVYRAPLLALVPLATVGISVWVALKLLTMASFYGGLPLVNITRVFVVVVLFGVGTDYCLFLIARYREELKSGAGCKPAMRDTLGHVGWTLVASAATVVGGLGLMGCAEFVKMRYTGPALAVSLLVSLAASLSLTPAFLAVFGRWVFWPGNPFAQAARTTVPLRRPGRWQAWTDALLRRPGRTWAVALVLLMPFAVMGYHTQWVYDVSCELPEDAPSRQGLAVIRDHFTEGEVGPVTLLLSQPGSWQEPATREWLRHLTLDLAKQPNVAEVRSLTHPLGTATQSSLLMAATQWLLRSKATSYYEGQDGNQQVTRIDVVLRTDPFSKRSLASLTALREFVEKRLRQPNAPAGSSFSCFGMTAIMCDVAAVQRSDSFLVNSLVIVVVQLIMLALVRRPLVAVYLLVSVVFSYLVTLGLTQVAGWAVLGLPFGCLDWKVPLFLFTILVAVGEDYNIFLMSRVLEEEPRRGLRAAVRLAVQQTGTTISSCGFIMAGTFATMLLGDLATLRQLGLALALGVMVDAFVVRLWLVPTFLLMLPHGKSSVEATPRGDVDEHDRLRPPSEMMRRAA